MRKVLIINQFSFGIFLKFGVTTQLLLDAKDFCLEPSVKAKVAKDAGSK